MLLTDGIQQDRAAALKLVPLLNLPKSLFLTGDSLIRPPLFHLGYLIDMARIVAYAEKHDLICTILGISARPGDSNGEITLVYEKEMDPRTTRAAVFRHMETVWGLDTIRLRCVPVPVNGTLLPLMSITTNHSYLYDPPSIGDICKLSTQWADGENPRWYLDGYEGEWQL